MLPKKKIASFEQTVSSILQTAKQEKNNILNVQNKEHFSKLK